jgi:hypothetical protein
MVRQLKKGERTVKYGGMIEGDTLKGKAGAGGKKGKGRPFEARRQP